MVRVTGGEVLEMTTLEPRRAFRAVLSQSAGHRLVSVGVAGGAVRDLAGNANADVSGAAVVAVDDLAACSDLPRASPSGAYALHPLGSDPFKASPNES